MRLRAAGARGLDVAARRCKAHEEREVQTVTTEKQIVVYVQPG